MSAPYGLIPQEVGYLDLKDNGRRPSWWGEKKRKPEPKRKTEYMILGSDQIVQVEKSNQNDSIRVSEPELKYFDSLLGPTSSYTGARYPQPTRTLTPLVEGVGATNRVGRQIKMHSIECNIQLTSEYNYLNNDYSNPFCRILLVKDRQNKKDTTQTLDQIFEGTPVSIGSWPNITNEERFEILWDEYFIHYVESAIPNITTTKVTVYDNPINPPDVLTPSWYGYGDTNNNITPIDWVMVRKSYIVRKKWFVDDIIDFNNYFDPPTYQNQQGTNFFFVYFGNPDINNQTSMSGTVRVRYTDV